MNNFLSRYATPFTVGLFLVSTISGVALFFHWQSKLFHGMHEWLSMLLLLPVVFHIQKNWFAMTGYFKTRRIWVPLLLSLAGGAVFIGLALNSPGRPPAPATSLIAKAPIAEIAPLFDVTPEALAAKLAAKGYAVATTEQTLETIAKKAGKPVDRVIAEIAGQGERD